VIAMPRQRKAQTIGTILLVDDDDEIRDVVALVLGSAGFCVVTAANGREALARLREDPKPTAILLDLMMPVMNGYEFRAEQLRDPALRAIPTLIFTAGAVTPQVKALGAEAILRKPVTSAQLLDALRPFSADPQH
jgi:CheY-like chemotaxis protein